MANNRRANHGAGRFFEEGMYNLAWGGFLGGVKLLGNIAGKWLGEKGPEEAFKAIRKATEEHRYDAWREVINLKDDIVDSQGNIIHRGNKEISQKIQFWRNQARKDTEHPFAEGKIVGALGHLWLSINGMEESGLSLTQKKIELRTTLINMCMDDNGQISETKFFENLDAFTASGTRQRAAGIGLFMSRQFQNLLPEGLRGKTIGEVIDALKVDVSEQKSRVTSRAAEFYDSFSSDFSESFKETREALGLQSALITEDPVRPTAVGNVFRNRVAKNRSKK